VLVEFYEGEMVVIPNDTPWHQATNFLRAAVGASPEGVCWRHDAISAQLEQTMGQTIGRGRLRPSGACVARRNPMVRRISNGPSPGACGDGATIRQRAHLQDSHSV
jgi:hypothetical protein